MLDPCCNKLPPVLLSYQSMVSLMPVALALKFGIDSFEQIDLLLPLVGAVMEGQVQDGAVTFNEVLHPLLVDVKVILVPVGILLTVLVVLFTVPTELLTVPLLANEME